MPSDLFGTVSSRRVNAPARGPSLLFLSAIGHLLIFLVVIVASLRATGPLPEPRTSVIFTPETRVVRIADARTDPPRRTPQASNAAPTSSPIPTLETPIDNRAPVEAPFTIAQPVPNAGGSGVIVFNGPLQQGPGDWDGVGGPGLGPVQRVEQPPAPVRQAPRRMAPGIREPKKIVNVTPEYPRLAQAAHIQGTVILEIIVGEQGNVDAVTVLRSVPALDRAAIDAVRRWRYEPGALNGTPIPVIITVTVNFSLGQ